MLPTKDIYAIYPSVYPANKAATVTIAPTERAFCFAEGTQYTITVASINSDEPNYYEPTCKKVFTVAACGGVLSFEYSFEGEQEHLVILEREDKVISKFFVYSLMEDLYDTLPVKADFHSHSYRSDGQRDPAALAGFYREQGYDAFALTDHNRFYPGREIDEVYEDVNTGFIRVSGEEVHAPASVIHIVHVGGERSVCAQYTEDPDRYNAEIEEYSAKLPSDLPEQYAYRYARAMWATDKIHEAGGLAILAHPYWRPKELVYNICDDFARLLLKSGMFDAYELVGGMRQVGINRSVNLWSELRAEGLDIAVVGSSDVHKLENSIYFPFCFTVVFAKEQSAKGIIDALREKRSVAVEANGTDEYARQFRAYGRLRYMSYAQFLLTNFFPKYERYCEGVGVAMRSYSMGDAPKALVELNAELAKLFRMRFFGRESAPSFGTELLEFEDRWRAVQIGGPQTKGSNINLSPNRQI